ncbi:hypothetical protein [Kitasatospora sp. NPDC047058]|uniref:hypothetical protein n=1 Tax=Kitasatospora sp. NPDC047058 TaxID=3155620 RepID=UPI0033CA535E
MLPNEMYPARGQYAAFRKGSHDAAVTETTVTTGLRLTAKCSCGWTSPGRVVQQTENGHPGWAEAAASAKTAAADHVAAS